MSAILIAAVPVSGASAHHRRPHVQNVILLIDDGAGYNAHVAGSLYDTGQRYGEAYNRFPIQLAVSTYSCGDVAVGACGDLVGYDPHQAWTDWSYVTLDPTDSAASATAMATGSKTYDAAIGVDCSGQPVANIVELAEARGMATGVVTSVPYAHATPAAFVAHNADRDDYLGIADEMINASATDVIMGGGHPFYSRFGKKTASPGYTWMSKTDYDALVAGTAGGDADGDGTADPWTFIDSREAFQALATGDTPSRVFGMAQVRRTLQQDRLPSGSDLNPAAYSVPPIANVPTLEEMARGALNVLDEDDDGFFLMIEGGATDWAEHDNQGGLLIEEELAFDRAVDAVVDWVREESSWGETLVIVTSDHETGYLTGPGSGDTPDGPVWTRLVNNGVGVLPGLQFNSDVHTNSLVPVYAKGDGAMTLLRHLEGWDRVRGPYVDNTAIFELLRAAISQRR